MTSIVLGRLALLSALSALVLAVLWTHIKRKVWFIIDILSTNVLSALFGSREQEQNGDLQDTHGTIIRYHPKLSGRSLKRTTGEFFRSTYRSLDGFGQSPSFVGGQPRFTLGPGHSAPSQILGVQQNSNGQSSIFLTFFAASIIVLILYTALRTLSARFGGHGNYRSKTGSCGGQNRYTGWNRAGIRRLDEAIDKRKLARLSREGRVRELILHHGGRNVSSAIRFLAGELEKHKQMLMRSLVEQHDKPCECSCHFDDDDDAK